MFRVAKGKGVFALLFVGLSLPLHAQLLDDVEREFEGLLLQRLATVQQSPDNSLAPFRSDGCSGGLSQAWQAIADLFPSFRKKYSNKPPWEACCVDHDRSYWRGDASEGYDKRKQADEALRQCVIASGKRNSHASSEELGLSPEQVEKAYQVAADMMYQAVRLGGRPCSLFEWRWGYGWPVCPIMQSP